MRWFYLAIVIVFVAALIIFVFQNTQSVGVSFLALSVTLPLAVLVFVVYVLGALSGGSLYALRSGARGARFRRLCAGALSGEPLPSCGDRSPARGAPEGASLRCAPWSCIGRTNGS